MCGLRTILTVGAAACAIARDGGGGRFSNDMTTIDEQLAQSLGEACQCLFNLLVTFAAISISSPWFLCLCPFLFALYSKIQAWFVTCSRELKRTANNALAF